MFLVSSGAVETPRDHPAPDSNETPQALLERALAAAGEGITIADARAPDMPLIHVNEAFEVLTGYTRGEVLGRNCRFLQGEATDPESVAEIRRALADKRGCIVELLNYRKDGRTFWNRLSITPVIDAEGRVSHFIGVQSDVTARRLAEERLQAANRKMRRDLYAAARIQKSLLPQMSPRIPGIEVAWAYQPCEELAGDTLNVLQLDANTAAFFMLDVSGHGVPAALLSFTLARTLSALPEQSCLYVRRGESWLPAPPSLVVATLNRRFQLDPAAPQYFTFFYALVDLLTGEVRYASAGHPPAVLVSRASEAQTLAATGPPVGLVEEAVFGEAAVTLALGDRLIVYTDGLNEAEHGEHGELGIERIVETVSTMRDRPLQEAVDALVALAQEWSGRKPHDDISVFALSRT